MSCSFFTASVTILLFVLPSWLVAEPSLNSVNLPGAQSGTTAQITFTGTDLGSNPTLVASFAISSQQALAGSNNKQAIIEFTTANESPGIHWVRIVSDKGITNPIAFALDDLSQTAFSTSIKSTPAAVYGNLAGGAILKTSFSGKQGTALVIDIEGRRLGSDIRPVLRLHNSQGVQVAWSPPQPTLSGDARIQTTLPADDTYTIELHDILFKGPAKGTFRLKIGELQFADMAFPIGTPAETDANLQFICGNLTVTAANTNQSIGTHPLKLPASPNVTGTRPYVLFSDHPEFMENDDAKQANEVGSVPVGINGRLSAKGEQDKFIVSTTPGTKLRINVLARQAGSPLDAVLTVQDAQGKQLGRNDDRPGNSDPGLDITIPKDNKSITVILSDLQNRGGKDYVYHIDIQNLSAPRFSISTTTNRIQVPGGSTQTLFVNITRQGYNGPINLSLPNLPDCISLSGTHIPAGSTRALLSISATPGEVLPVITHLLATGTGDHSNVQTIASVGDDSNHYRVQPYLKSKLALARVPTSLITAALLHPTSELQVTQGKFLPLEVNLGRADNTSGNIRLRLISTQVQPRKKIKKGGKDVEVDDLDRTLRLVEEPLVGADKNDHTVNVWVPHDLGTTPWNVAIIAELLSEDNKNVLATTTTSQLIITPRQALALKLTSTANIEAVAGEGDSGSVSGTITRAAMFDKAVTITLRGLPKGYTAPSLEIAADINEFTLPIQFSKEAKPGDLKNIKLVATAASDLKAEVQVVSNSETIQIKVVPQAE
ncbi:MAG: hypothetical protein HOB73_10790 [Planctomycetaceae bacterium]|jgi:hypothetical protein|nr:hypothetical protein [Planctomycetaceae bacterium]